MSNAEPANLNDPAALYRGSVVSVQHRGDVAVAVADKVDIGVVVKSDVRGFIGVLDEMFRTSKRFFAADELLVAKRMFDEVSIIGAAAKQRNDARRRCTMQTPDCIGVVDERATDPSVCTVCSCWEPSERNGGPR